MDSYLVIFSMVQPNNVTFSQAGFHFQTHHISLYSFEMLSSSVNTNLLKAILKNWEPNALILVNSENSME